MANNTGQKFGGRTKGTPNRTTTEIRQNFQLLIENNLETLESDLKELEPKDRIKAILELSKFVLPILRATELSTTTDNKFQPIMISLGSGINPELSNGTNDN
jgi:hypothetical protein